VAGAVADHVAIEGGVTVDLQTAREELAGRTVLVTGAGGFIGGRLVERLVLECGAEVRALSRRVAGAVRLARFPVSIVRGDVTDRRDVEAAAEGCDVVFHCAYGTSGSQRLRGKVNRLGTRNVLEAAGRAGASRVVHLSTLMVYGETGDGDLTEEAPRRRLGNVYADSKRLAERSALEMARSGRVPATVLQPTAVYGPYGGVWTERVLTALRTGRVILVDGGRGLANHVYVDDLVSAMLLAAVEPAAVGEAFLVSSAEPATWKELYGAFERMIGQTRTVSMSAQEAREVWRRHRRARPWALPTLVGAIRGDRELRDRLFATRELVVLRELASTLLPEPTQRRVKAWISRGRPPGGGGAGSADQLPVHPLSPGEIAFLQARTRVRIDKARRVLGFRPVWDLEAGTEMTERWARWADLVP